jgi:hypothetical protein
MGQIKKRLGLLEPKHDCITGLEILGNTRATTQTQMQKENLSFGLKKHKLAAKNWTESVLRQVRSHSS